MTQSQVLTIIYVLLNQLKLIRSELWRFEVILRCILNIYKQKRSLSSIIISKKQSKQMREQLRSRDCGETKSYQTIITIGTTQEIKNICLGQGGYAKVFACWDSSTKQTMAAKVISKEKILSKIYAKKNPDKKKEFYLKSLKNEVLIMISLNHPNILQLYNYHETENNLYFILQYCNQGNLAEFIDREKRINYKLAAALFADLIEACLFLKKNNIIHRDIKPSNILLHNGQAKLCDFGFAVKLDSTGSFEGDYVVGTKEYMPPQGKINDKIDEKYDVWSLGVTFYEMLFGHLPWTDKSTTHTNRDSLAFPDNVDVPIKVKVGLRRMLNPQKTYRASFEEVKNIICE